MTSPYREELESCRTNNPVCHVCGCSIKKWYQRKSIRILGISALSTLVTFPVLLFTALSKFSPISCAAFGLISYAQFKGMLSVISQWRDDDLWQSILHLKTELEHEGKGTIVVFGGRKDLGSSRFCSCPGCQGLSDYMSQS